MKKQGKRKKRKAKGKCRDIEKWLGNQDVVNNRGNERIHRELNELAQVFIKVFSCWVSLMEMLFFYQINSSLFGLKKADEY